MNVICIDAGKRETAFASPDGWCIIEGETYTTSGRVDGVNKLGNKVSVYILEEDPSAPEYGWAVDRFAPLSSIDETTFERNYSTEKI